MAPSLRAIGDDFWKTVDRYVHLVQTILASCVRFNVVPRLLIEAQRSIELQATGVDVPLAPCHSVILSPAGLPRVPLSSSRPTLPYLLYSFLCLLKSVGPSLSHTTPAPPPWTRGRVKGRTIRIPFPSNYNSSPFQSSSHAAFISRACARAARQKQ